VDNPNLSPPICARWGNQFSAQLGFSQTRTPTALFLLTPGFSQVSWWCEEENGFNRFPGRRTRSKAVKTA